MTSLPASFARAFAQLADRRVLWLLLKSLIVTIVLFVAAGAALYVGLAWLIDRGLGSLLDENLPPNLAAVASAIGTVAAVVFGGWLLFRVTALAAIQFFADDVVEVVESQYYPEALASARRIGFGESMWIGLKGALRVVFYNLLILPLALVLLVTGVGTVVLFAVLNAWLLGRELRDMAWLRHRHDSDAKPPLGIGTRSALGGIVALMLLIPGLNFIAPIIGAAAATHLVQGRLRDA
ncbi:EI24 domain-containing protein [Alteriqipengyuania sp. 357]